MRLAARIANTRCLTHQFDRASLARHTLIRTAPTIAIDGRLLGRAAGLARYTGELVRALVDHVQERDDRFLVLTGNRAQPHLLPKGVPTIRCLTPPHHQWERFILPLELTSRLPGLKLLHSTDHVAPAWGGWRSVVTVHDAAFALYPETHTAASRRYYAGTAPSVRRAHRVIAVSHATATAAIQILGADPSRVRIVPEAAGPAFVPQPAAERDRLAASRGLDLNSPYLIWVGSFEPRKNLRTLFQALEVVRRTVGVSLLLVVSAASTEATMAEDIRRAVKTGSTHVLTGVSDADLAVLYSHAAACVYPSLYEGFGLVALEAMACGAPVVASDVDAIREVVTDAGILVDPMAVRTWAGAVNRLLVDPNLARQLRGRGLERAEQFSWSQSALATKQVYLEALAA